METASRNMHVWPTCSAFYALLGLRCVSVCFGGQKVRTVSQGHGNALLKRQGFFLCRGARTGARWDVCGITRGLVLLAGKRGGRLKKSRLPVYFLFRSTLVWGRRRQRGASGQKNNDRYQEENVRNSPYYCLLGHFLLRVRREGLRSRFRLGRRPLAGVRIAKTQHAPRPGAGTLLPHHVKESLLLVSVEHLLLRE